MPSASTTAYELGLIRTDRGRFTDKGNIVYDVTHPDFGNGGAKGDGVTDDILAFEAALAAMSEDIVSPDSNGPRGRGAILYIPAGRYYLSRALHITKMCMVQGAHGWGWYPGTELIFPEGLGTAAVIVDYYLGDARGRGDWSIIRDIGIKAKLTPGLTTTEDDVSHGIHLKARAKLENFNIWGFQGDGIHIDAGVPDENANLFVVRDGTIYYCRNGMYVAGNDGNAGVVEGVDCSYNRVWGFFDVSFLGNTYIGCHTATNGHNPADGASFFRGGSYSMGYTYGTDGDDGTGGNLSSSLLLNCYAETDQNAGRFDQYCLTLGGPALTATDASMGGLVQANNQGIRIGPQAVFHNRPDAADPVSFIAGTTATTPWAFQFDADETAGADLYAMAYNFASTGWWSLVRAGTNVALSLSGASAAEGPGFPRFDNGYYIGSASTQRKRHFGTAAPIAGTWAVGDYVENISPAAGGFMGWVCTTAGTPGTWKTYGAITA